MHTHLHLLNACDGPEGAQHANGTQGCHVGKARDRNVAGDNDGKVQEVPSCVWLRECECVGGSGFMRRCVID